jgi:hypothetical protein
VLLLSLLVWIFVVILLVGVQFFNRLHAQLYLKMLKRLEAKESMKEDSKVSKVDDE